MDKIRSRTGFTLVEILIFVTILSIFLITAMTVLISALRNMQISEHKIIATRYAEELTEWLRSEKEEDINNFISHFSANSVYCFNDPNNLDWSYATAGNCPNFNGLNPPIYKREVTFQLEDISGTGCFPGSYASCRINLRVVVSWRELGNIYQVPIKTVLNIWEG